MTPAAENLRVLLEGRDIDGFLEAFESYRQQHTVEPVVTALTQRVFPPLLRQAFKEDNLQPPTVVRLYRMVRTSRLVLVEEELSLASTSASMKRCGRSNPRLLRLLSLSSPASTSSPGRCAGRRLAQSTAGACPRPR